MVYLPQFGSKMSTIAFKYLGQWRRTSRILRAERPDTVFVMTPPVFAALPAFWYAWRHRKQVVLDAHTAAFLFPRWKHLQWLQRLLCRRAVTTLVSNTHLGDVVRAAGGHATLVPDVPIVFEGTERFERPATFTVAAICSFDYDEPIEALFEAAARLPHVTFFVTGNPRKVPAAVRERLTANVRLTGFLSTEMYGSLLTRADVALVLTSSDHTMLRGAYEAIYQGTPVIVSNWQILRDAFPIAAVHVDNTAEAIAEGVRLAEQCAVELRSAAQQLRQHKYDRWLSTRRQILSRIGAATAATQATHLPATRGTQA